MVQMAIVANGSDWLVVGEADSGGGLLGVRVAGDGNIIDTTPVTLVAGSYFLHSRVSLHARPRERPFDR